MAREPTALLLEAASHYDEINRNDVVSTLNSSERLIATQDMPYRQGMARPQNIAQRQAGDVSGVSSSPPKRKPRHVDISNLTVSSLAVVESLAEALSYIEGLHGKQPFRVSEHLDPDTNAPYLLFDSGDVKIVAQNSHLSNISPETSDLLKLELLDE